MRRSFCMAGGKANSYIPRETAGAWKWTAIGFGIQRPVGVTSWRSTGPLSDHQTNVTPFFANPDRNCDSVLRHAIHIVSESETGSAFNLQLRFLYPLGRL